MDPYKNTNTLTRFRLKVKKKRNAISVKKHLIKTNNLIEHRIEEKKILEKK